MADPLSITSSIAGILILGVRVSTGLAEIISDAKTADSLLTEITNDLLILCDILGKIEALTCKWQASAADPLLPGLLERCRASLKELESIITAVQESFARGGLQKRWLQVTWASKQKEISAISGKISGYKSTLTLTLQMQNASDMGDVKDAIQAFLASRNEPHGRIERRTETLDRFLQSAATSLYSVNRAPSYASSSIYGTTGSSFRSRVGSMRFSASASTDPRKATISTFDDITLAGSDNTTTGSSTLVSSSTLPGRNLEYIQIPPSLLDPNIGDAEQFWSKLAPELHLTSPAPYTTFQELYQRIYPYLWLHGHVWHGDRATYGTLLVTKYSAQTGKIEFTRIQPTKSGVGPLSYATGETPTFQLGRAIPGLRIEPPTGHEQDRVLTNPYSFHRVSPLSEDGQSSTSEQSLWPPIIFPAADRTTRSHAASQHHCPPVEQINNSRSLFELTKASTSGFGRMGGPRVELFAALDPKLYTPNLEHPLRGIWWCKFPVGIEFILFHQKSRYQVEGLKLTGDLFLHRGTKTLGFDNIQAERLSGKIMGGLGRFLNWSDECALTWDDYNHVTIGVHGQLLHFYRLEIEQFL